jgi:hypothetical protein
MKPTKSVFTNEAALCQQFISKLPEGWTAYPETAGFDILLIRNADGAQVGIEAKLTLNAKVVLQSLGYEDYYSFDGPDFRATLVPSGTAGGELKQIARRLGIVTIEVMSDEVHGASMTAIYGGRVYLKSQPQPFFSPDLPAIVSPWGDVWLDHCPPRRCKLPEYVPDVGAGHSAPIQLSDWKIRAIKICVILERRGYVTMEDFKHLQINRQRWIEMRWLSLTETRGKYVAGARPIDLRAQHPVNYEQIAADFDKWAPKDTPLFREKQEALL